MKGLTAVYGGTFDPPTYGHWQSIKKACAIFEKVYIVVATAPGKNTTFSQQKRILMLNQTIPEDLWKDDGRDPQVEIISLPEGVYLATFAKQLGAQFLVRGIRDAFDFQYENQIYKTNRQIEPDIETIYIMPDKDLEMVSSSWIKGLVGHNGWRKTVRPYISKYTLKELSLNYAFKRFSKIIKNPIFNLKWSEEDIFQAWYENYIVPMKVNTYHNVFHVMDCLEAMDLYWGQDPIMEYALWLHDVVPSVDESVIIAVNTIASAKDDVKKQVATLIKATKHDRWKFETEDEEMIASIDLLPLGYNYLSFHRNTEILYEEYRERVFQEYLNKDGGSEQEFFKKWTQGRIDFLKSMISVHSRDYIYPHQKIRNMFECQAKSNISQELKNLEKVVISS